MKLQGRHNDGVMPIHLGASVVCCLLLIAGFAFGYAPLMSQNQKSTTVIEQADQAEVDATRVKQELDSISEKLVSVQSELDEQPVGLQSASQINPLLSQLANWSEVHGLSITRTNAGRPEALAYYDYVPLQIAGEGGFTALLGFFDQINDERGDLGLTSFQLTRLSTGKGVSFELELAWYVLGEETPQPFEATATAPTRQ